MGYMLSRRKHARKVLNKANNRRHTEIISHVNSNESNKLEISNLDNIKITSTCPYTTVKK